MATPLPPNNGNVTSNIMAAGGGGGTSTSQGSWFQGAPLSKSITMLVIISYVIIESWKLHAKFDLDMDKVLGEGQLHRLVLCHITFSSVGEMVFGLALLSPLMKRFEREMGSRKLGTFLTFTLIVSTSIELLLSQILHEMVIRYSGPYSLIGSLLFLFHVYTPRLYPRFFGLFGFDFSEKSLTYLLAFQVSCFYGGFGTLIPSACGFLAGYLCSTPSLPLRKWELPEFCYGLFGIFAETPVPIYVSRRIRSSSRNVAAAAAAAAATAVGGLDRGFPTAAAAGGGGGQVLPDARFGPATQQFESVPPSRPPSEEVVEQLTNMGFEREAAIRALQQTDNNVEAAVNRLLTSS